MEDLDLAQVGGPPFRQITRAVGAVVIDDEHVGVGHRPPNRLEEGLDVLRLVIGGHDDHRSRRPGILHGRRCYRRSRVRHGAVATPRAGTGVPGGTRNTEAGRRSETSSLTASATSRGSGGWMKSNPALPACESSWVARSGRPSSVKRRTSWAWSSA